MDREAGAPSALEFLRGFDYEPRRSTSFDTAFSSGPARRVTPGRPYVKGPRSRRGQPPSYACIYGTECHLSLEHTSGDGGGGHDRGFGARAGHRPADRPDPRACAPATAGPWLLGGAPYRLLRLSAWRRPAGGRLVAWRAGVRRGGALPPARLPAGWSRPASRTQRSRRGTGPGPADVTVGDPGAGPSGGACPAAWPGAPACR